MSEALLITSIITVGLAFIGYFATYVANLRLQRRRDHLERVNRQLSELYGPLYALIQAAHNARDELMKVLGFPINSGVTFSEENIEIWRSWILTVFMPLNRQMLNIIIGHSDLIIETEFPRCFQDMCSHIVAWEPVIAAWPRQEVASIKPADNLSIFDFPPAAEPYVINSYRSLKSEQAKLIAQVQQDGIEDRA